MGYEGEPVQVIKGSDGTQKFMYQEGGDTTRIITGDALNKGLWLLFYAMATVGGLAIASL